MYYVFVLVSSHRRQDVVGPLFVHEITASNACKVKSTL